MVRVAGKTKTTAFKPVQPVVFVSFLFCASIVSQKHREMLTATIEILLIPIAEKRIP